MSAVFEQMEKGTISVSAVFVQMENEENLRARESAQTKMEKICERIDRANRKWKRSASAVTAQTEKWKRSASAVTAQTENGKDLRAQWSRKQKMEKGSAKTIDRANKKMKKICGRNVCANGKWDEFLGLSVGAGHETGVNLSAWSLGKWEALYSAGVLIQTSIEPTGL